MHSERGFDRMVNFCDAVVAIAMTLLVLPLVDLPAEIRDRPVVDALWDDHRGELFAFFLSFVVIARFWMGHHAVFEGVARSNRTLLRLNLVWLLTIVFLPFPTELMGDRGDDRATTGLYIATLLCSSAILAVISEVASREGVAARAERSDEAVVRRAEDVTTPLLLAVALVLATVVAGVGPWALLLLFFQAPVSKGLVRLQRRRH